MNRKYQCACCGYYTLDEKNEYEVCPVCYWEDDPFMRKNETEEGGANAVSLVVARANHEKFGAMEERFVQKVRAPLPEEVEYEIADEE